MTMNRRKIKVGNQIFVIDNAPSSMTDDELKGIAIQWLFNKNAKQIENEMNGLGVAS